MSQVLKATRPISASHRAAEQLRQFIFNGELAADSNHLESELADRLGISRTPAREASLMVQAQGLLEVQPRKGVRIKSFSLTEFDEIYQVLTELECLAVRLAAQIQHSGAELTSLLTYIDAMESALNIDQLDAWLSAEFGFHEQLVALSGNAYLVMMAKHLHDLLRRPHTVIRTLHHSPTQSHAAHRALHHALVTGDAAEADRVHREHRNETRVSLTAILEQAGINRI